MKILIYLFFVSVTLTQEKPYFCPPCASNCHDIVYKESGICPTCNMILITRKTTNYKAYNKKMLQIKSADIKLNAALYKANEQVNKRNAAVVIVHGSAPSTIEDLSYYIRLSTELGLTVLAFDKRGTGKSEGKFEYFSVEGSERWFQLLASDVSAAVDYLKVQKDIDPEKIGLFGGSQAGWIMPLAASINNNISFFISGEGATVSAGEEHYFSQITADGANTNVTIQDADEKLKSFDGFKGFNPAPILKKLSTKALWIFGTSDPVIPVDASIRLLNELKKPNFEIVILANGDHNFKNTRTNKQYDLLSYILPWLKEQKIIH